MQRALRVVLEGGRSPEDRHHCIARELLDRAPRQLDLVTHGAVEALELRPDALGVTLSGVGGRADEVGEENRDELALLARAHLVSVPNADAPR